MSQTMKYLKDKYCNGEFTKCTRFRISMYYGRDNVPTYIYPNDFFEIPNTLLNPGEKEQVNAVSCEIAAEVNKKGSQE